MTKLDNDLISRKALLEAVNNGFVEDAADAIYLITNAPTIEADSGEAVAKLWESIGRWSAYLASNGEQAELSPPSWLVDAINNATSPKQREWKDIDLSEYEIQGLGAGAEEICEKLKQLNMKG